MNNLVDLFVFFQLWVFELRQNYFKLKDVNFSWLNLGYFATSEPLLYLEMLLYHLKGQKWMLHRYENIDITGTKGKIDRIWTKEDYLPRGFRLHIF